MLAVLAQRLHQVKFLVSDNSTVLLTSMGVGGTVATAYLTGRASFKAAEILRHEKEQLESVEENGQTVVRASFIVKELSRSDTVKLVWRLYIPPVGAGLITITSIIAANKISSKKIAALTVASGISERALKEYKEKVLEKLGEKQERNIHDEIAQDRVTQNPPGSREVIIAGTGDVLCYDMTTGRYFQSSMEKIKRAENKVNYDLIHFMSASLSTFYDEIGLPPTTYTDSVGWNVHNKMEVRFSTTMSQNEQPCLAIDFVRPPLPDYDRSAWD